MSPALTITGGRPFRLPLPSRATVMFTVRVLLAATLALYAAYALQLDTPYSAATTVFVLMHASRGAIISKSAWRILGSLAGAAAGVIIIACFVQAPLLFILATAAWIGMCTFAGSLLRHNRGYGAVLAGYTVTLIAVGAVSTPERIFDIALGRLAVVTIGVVSTAVIFLVTDMGPGRARLERSITGLIARSAALLSRALAGEDAKAVMEARHKLAMELDAIDQAVEFAAVEDAGLARYRGDLRLSIAELFSALVGGLHVVKLLEPLGETSGLSAMLAGALTGIADMHQGGRAGSSRVHIRGTIEKIREEAANHHSPDLLAAAADAAALLEQFDMALAGLEALQEGVRLKSTKPLPYYKNPNTAVRNGLRAAIAVTLAGLFWIFSRWPDGGAMLSMLGPICALLALTNSAARSSVQFLCGVGLGVLAALGCSYGLLPLVTGFPLLIAVLSPFLIFGIVASRVPRLALVGNAFLVAFMTMVAPTNPMHFDLAASINSGIALTAGAAFAALSFRVLLPPNPAREADYLARSIAKAVRALSSRATPPARLAWEHLQHQRVVRLSSRLASRPQHRIAAVAEATGAILIGRHLIALRRMAAGGLPALREAAGRALAALNANPDSAAAIRHQARLLETQDTPDMASLRLAGTLNDLAGLVATHRRVFTKGEAA